jgi:hypothetical protein
MPHLQKQLLRRVESPMMAIGDGLSYIGLVPMDNLTRRKLVADLDLPPNEDTNPGLRDRDFIVVRSSFGANILNAVTRTLGDIVTPITLLDRLTRN